MDLVTLVGLLPGECKKESSISWACDTANTAGVFKSLVNYKKKFGKGIISSWQDYDEKGVSENYSSYSVYLFRLLFFCVRSLSLGL